ncbi:MAG: 4-alpha-glucanotransferase [Brevinematales bacterium]|nr:4-alpha-glucanotransferase [Brevinematales bacterium]
MQFPRSSGVLLHITSLPNRYGIGSMGKEAYRFVDFLVSARQKLWQVFPLGPTGFGDSPYQCFSAFAGNPLLIDLELLVEQGLLSKKDLEGAPVFPEDKVDYGAVIHFKFPLLRKAYENFVVKAEKQPLLKEKFERFCERHKNWLDDFALFMALKEEFGGRSWLEWEKDVRFRKPETIKAYSLKLADKIVFQKFRQYLFFDQWHDLRAYANKNGVQIVGDIPIFVAMDSADVWAHPELFYFDPELKPTKVAGVPPDYFSATGQLWGNPLYYWPEHEKTNFQWWISRIESMMELVDIIRIDHFRGFAGYWAIPYGEKTAINGQWEKAPGMALFTAVEKALGKLPIIAEDLGVITPDVVELRDHFQFPGMKVLQFAFDSNEENDHLPHQMVPNSVIYTGTHDNDTCRGWFEKAKPSDQQYALEYLKSNGKEVWWDFIQAAWASVARIAIAPMQDILGLGSSARMNFPGVASGNWQWRMKSSDLKPALARRLAHLTRIYGR